MNFTPQQLRAIEERGRDVFVEAGAGTGKTALMVERYLRFVLEDRVPPDRVLTVTFTRKAAGELRTRIRSELIQRRRPDLAAALDSAPIDTIHGLCSRILRAHAISAGVDPVFGVMDDQQAAILRSRLANDVWASLIAHASAPEALMLATHRRDLTVGVPVLYERLRGLGLEEPRFTPEPVHDIQAALAHLDACLREVISRTADCSGSKGSLENLVKARECLGWLGSGKESPSADQLDAALVFWPSLTCGAAMKPFFRDVQEALAGYRAAAAEMLLLPLASLADRFLSAFHSSMKAEKEARGLLDFADLELHCLRVLRGGVRPFPRGCHLMVDEFQDTNQMQWDILEHLGATAILTVGDEHQSIYGFRGADVEVFRRCRRKRLSEGSSGAIYPLTVNFRSRSSVLAAISSLFSVHALFGPEYTALEASRGDGPRPGTAEPRGSLSPAVEMVVLPGSGTEDSLGGVGEREARAIARHVARLVSEEGWRPRDIVVLLRALTHVGHLEEALHQYGLVPYVVGGRDYLAHEEVSDVRALLRVVANPRDDMALVSVLRSPLVGVSDDCLYLLAEQRASRGDGAFWPLLSDGAFGGLPAGDRERLAPVAACIDGLRRRVGRPGLATLVQEAVIRFDYDLAVLGDCTGRRRFANLRKLMSMAEGFEEISGPDLKGFLEYLDDLGNLELKEGSAAVLGELGEVVRIMSIHQAKGLEFPVVVMAGLGTGHRGGRGDVFPVGKDLRAGIVLHGQMRKASEAPMGLGPVGEILAEKEARDAEEEVRLLYVGMTRAEERLLLVIHAAEEATKWSGSLGGKMLAALGLETLPEAWVRPVAGLDLLVSRDAPQPDRTVASVDRTQAEAGPGLRVPGGAGELQEPLVLVAAPAPPEIPSAGEQRRLPPLSFSSLARYVRCPRRYYLERVLRIVADGTFGDRLGDMQEGLSDRRRDFDGLTGEGAEGRDTGLIVHRVLEWADLGAQTAPSDLSALVMRAASEFAVPREGRAAARAEALAAAFWRSPLAGRSELCDAAKEQPFAFAHGGTLITGVMDLVIRDGSIWHVVDYKTNRLPVTSPGPSSVGADSDVLRSVAEDYRLQAEIYALAGLLAGAAVVEVSFLLLEAPEATQKLVFTAEELPALEAALTEVLCGLQTGAYPRRSASCPGCDYELLCNALQEDGSPVDGSACG